MGKVFIGGGMDSVRLLVNDGSPEANEGYISAANQSLPLRMKYLRWIYFILFLQHLISSIVVFILYMTPGVRPYVQQPQNNYIVYTSIGLIILTTLLLKYVNKRNYLLIALMGILYTTAFTIFIAVFSLRWDSEAGYIVPALMCSVFVCNATYCLQSLRELAVLHSVAATLLISVVMSVFLQVLLSLFTYDYVLNLALTNGLCLYVHYCVRHSMSKFTCRESLKGWASVFTTLAPFYK